MDEGKKAKTAIGLSDLPDGLKELVDASPETRQDAILLPAARIPQQPSRPKTAKETELYALISKRQEIIEKLKGKNPLVIEARKKIAELVPSIRGNGASHTMKLASEAEHVEFSIATEAYTPKKEKELIKRLRGIRQELAKHKEVDAARKAVDSQRHALHAVVSDVRNLERELAEVRGKCDIAYAKVLAERKSAYEQRQKSREERRHRQLVELQERVHEEKRKRHDAELKPYFKNYGDTVPMDEVVVIEKKEKKRGE